MSVLIIDYGMCNLGSIRRSVELCDVDVVVSSSPSELDECSAIILPGVGSFGDGMKNLREEGWLDILRDTVLNVKIPILGICLGMQLLSSKGYEGGEHEGLGFIDGEVKLLKSSDVKERIPHMGWNEVEYKTPSPLFEGIKCNTDFYFVHSYHFVCSDDKDVVTQTPYCGGITSTVGRDNIYGVQFHPEKSSRAGMQLLKNFFEIAGC
jgi:glutamine amidotransferase